MTSRWVELLVDYAMLAPHRLAQESHRTIDYRSRVPWEPLVKSNHPATAKLQRNPNVGLLAVFASVLMGDALVTAQAFDENLPPTVSILWPRGGESFTYPNAVRIKASASDLDGSISAVEFFVETNLVATAISPPFNALWQVTPDLPCDSCSLRIVAIAVDNLGARTESLPVSVHFSSTQPPFTYLEFLAPNTNATFAAPATFVISAELLASHGEVGSVEFFANTNFLGRVDVPPATPLTAATAPYFLTASNLAQGEYQLSVKYPVAYCNCEFMFQPIHVVKLALQFPRLDSGGHFQCEIVSSLTNLPTIIEISSDLLDWTPIRTNPPSSSPFTFIDPFTTTNRLFYRLRVPPE